MRDMKNDRFTWKDKHKDMVSLAKTVADALVLGALGCVLCVLFFSLIPYTGG
jgi:hypothetical protein